MYNLVALSILIMMYDNHLYLFPSPTETRYSLISVFFPILCSLETTQLFSLFLIYLFWLFHVNGVIQYLYLASFT